MINIIKNIFENLFRFLENCYQFIFFGMFEIPFFKYIIFPTLTGLLVLCIHNNRKIIKSHLNGKIIKLYLIFFINDLHYLFDCIIEISLYVFLSLTPRLIFCLIDIVIQSFRLIFIIVFHVFLFVIIPTIISYVIYTRLFKIYEFENTITLIAYIILVSVIQLVIWFLYDAITYFINKKTYFINKKRNQYQ